MEVTGSIEEVKELREVTVTLGFQFVDGVLANAEDQAMYDLVAPVGDEMVSDVESSEVEPSTEELPNHY